MRIIERKDLDTYRYIVGKIVFLNIYKEEYNIVEDIPHSNCFIANNHDNSYIIISLFKQPSISKKYQNYTVWVFYEKKQKGNNTYVNQQLSDRFIKHYDEAIGEAFFSPPQFVEKYSNGVISLDEMLESIYIAKDTSGSLFKYYSTKIESNNYGTLDGNVSFMNPIKFNDPFDCTCLFANGQSISDKFRVFCSILDKTDILMWSYYGEDHKGYCFEYSKHDIISTLINSKMNALCIIGDVKYEDERPNYKLKTSTLSFSNIKDLITCTFTKYKKWEHEKEFRFVLISDSFNDNGESTQITIPILNIYRGCNNSKTMLYSNGQPLKTTQLVEDTLEYKIK